MTTEILEAQDEALAKVGEHLNQAIVLASDAGCFAVAKAIETAFTEVTKTRYLIQGRMYS